MAERQQREKQQISIPYLWEDKPGLPKKAWTSQGAVATPMAVAAPPTPSPARLVVSVPFEWEEKPGTPLRPTPAIPDLLISTEIDPLPAPELYWNPFDEITHPLNPFIGKEETAVSDLEAFSFEKNVDIGFGMAKTNEPFAVFPDAWESFSENGSYWNENWQSASETDGDGGSWSSRSSSAAEEEIKDTSVIEFLFPLASPGSSFPGSSVKDEAPPAPMVAHEDTAMARRMLTLEELILLSRKLSCRRKQQISLKNTNHKKEDLKKSVLSCFPFIYNSNKRLRMITT